MTDRFLVVLLASVSPGAERVGRGLLQWPLPGPDLSGMDLEARGNLYGSSGRPESPPKPPGFEFGGQSALLSLHRFAANLV